MNISPTETVARLRERMALLAETDAPVRARLRSVLPALVATLVTDFHVGRVVLFGSLAYGTTNEYSDIDLAVEGLSSELYFPALAHAADIAGCEVNLVPIDEAPPALQRIIKERGEVLYESR
jgi:predicted nucleotidyltransferase